MAILGLLSPTQRSFQKVPRALKVMLEGNVIGRAHGTPYLQRLGMLTGEDQGTGALTDKREPAM